MRACAASVRHADLRDRDARHGGEPRAKHLVQLEHAARAVAPVFQAHGDQRGVLALRIA
jgi:hypothetical protein